MFVFFLLKEDINKLKADVCELFTNKWLATSYQMIRGYDMMLHEMTIRRRGW